MSLNPRVSNLTQSPCVIFHRGPSTETRQLLRQEAFLWQPRDGRFIGKATTLLILYICEVYTFTSEAYFLESVTD